MKTSEKVVGRWSNVLPMLGISSDFLTGKHTACPICKTGKDKFRFDDKQGNGTFFCNDCGAGGGWKLLEMVNGWDFKTAANEVDRVIDNAKAAPIVKSDDTDKNRRRLNALRKRIVTIGKSKSLIEYLNNRGIDTKLVSKLTASLGFVPDLEYWENGCLKGWYEAMTALVITAEKPSTYHITFIKDGAKAALKTSRKVLPPSRPIAGGAVRLFGYANKLGIAEGIETAMAATQLFDIPTWAALNSHNLASFLVPDNVTELHVYGDNDETFTGQKAAYELAWRAARSGLDVYVHIPTTSNSDWNDVLLEREGKSPIHEYG